MHHLTDNSIRWRDQQITECYRSNQCTLGIQNITDIDGLTVHTYLSDPVNGILYCHIFLQIHILHSHDTASRIFRIAKKMIDISPRICTGICQKLLDYIGRHLFQKVCRIIRHQIINDVGGFLVGQTGDDHLLMIHFQIRKHICCHALWQYTEYL